MNRNSRASDRKTSKGLGSRVNHRIQTTIPPKELSLGDVSDKIAIPLSDGKTIVFAKTKEDVENVRKQGEELINRKIY